MCPASSSRLTTRRAQLPSRRDAEREVGVAFTDPIASGEAHGVAMQSASSPREAEVATGYLGSTPGGGARAGRSRLNTPERNPLDRGRLSPFIERWSRGYTLPTTSLPAPERASRLSGTG
jgi:hypothetical protein